MTAPTIYEWPRAWWPWVSGSLQIMPRSLRSESPWTKGQSIYGPHVRYWTGRFAFPALSNQDAAEREAFLEQIVGTKDLLRIGHPLRARPKYSRLIAPNAPLPSLISCAGSARKDDTSVVVGGAELPASTDAVFSPGDLVQFNRDGIADETPSLHRIVRLAPTDADGLARIEFLPALRKGLAEGDQVQLDYATSVFLLMDDDQARFDYSANIGTHGLQLIEYVI